MSVKTTKIDTQTLAETTEKVCKSVLEYHYCAGCNCEDDCVALHLMVAIVAKHKPEFYKALVEAKEDKDVYRVLLKQMYAETPTAANEESIDDFEDYLESLEEDDEDDDEDDEDCEDDE
jgi:hypothetical protein